MGRTIPNSGEVLASFNTLSLISLGLPGARHRARLWENKPVTVLVLESSQSRKKTSFIHAFTQPPFTKHLLCASLGGSEGKASACNAGDPGSIPGSGRSPGEGNGNPLQYSCLENPMARGAWWATVHGVAKSQTRLSNFTSVPQVGHGFSSKEQVSFNFSIIYICPNPFSL